MNEQTNERMNEQTNEWTNEWTSKQMSLWSRCWGLTCRFKLMIWERGLVRELGAIKLVPFPFLCTALSLPLQFWNCSLALGRAPQSYLRGEWNCKSLYGFEIMSGGGSDCHHKPEWPHEGDALGHKSQGTVEQSQGVVTAEPGTLGPVVRAPHRFISSSHKPPEAAVIVIL